MGGGGGVGGVGGGGQWNITWIQFQATVREEYERKGLVRSSLLTWKQNRRLGLEWGTREREDNTALVLLSLSLYAVKAGGQLVGSHPAAATRLAQTSRRRY